MLSNIHKRTALDFDESLNRHCTVSQFSTSLPTQNRQRGYNCNSNGFGNGSASRTMSLWKRIAANREIEQRMKQYYDEKGLAEIRVFFAPWIEERIMSERLSNSNSELYEHLALQFIEELKQKLINLSRDNLMKFKINEICTLVSQTPAVDIYNHMRNGLQKEIQLLDQMPQNPYMCAAPGAVNMMGGSFNSMHTGDELFAATGRIQKLALEVERLRGTIQAFTTEYETFHSYFNEYSQNKHVMTPEQAAENDQRMDQQFAILVAKKNTLSIEIRRLVIEYDAIQELVLAALKNWQRNQALAGNGFQFRDNLDDIQRCIEMLVDIVCKLLAYLNILNNIGEADSNLVAILEHVRHKQECLILSAFIVEKQPPQVMKTNTRFAAAVRWLIGPQFNIHLNAPTVECIILSEAQAQRHAAQRTMVDSSSSTPPHSGEIQSNVSTMEYQQQNRVFSASFRNMQLKKIKRAEKKGTESVMDEKFALLFYTTCLFNDSMRIRAWTLSLPVVVIVHGNQEPQSWATITWDNAFSDIIREPFQVPDKVSWQQLSVALNTKFASATGRQLTEENLNFLHEKLIRNDGMVGDHKDYITWAQFCKEPLPDRSFTFWDWFFAIMKLTKDHLLGLWKAGLVVGFINKRKTMEEILPNTRPGTFLLRFSDSELGGITIGWVGDLKDVRMLSPWTARDLNIRGLADRVHDIGVLCYVYPTNAPKDEAFHEFYTTRMGNELSTHDGYVPNTIKAHVPAIEGGSLSATPQYHMNSPHPQDIHMANDNFTITDFDSILYE